MNNTLKKALSIHKGRVFLAQGISAYGDYVLAASDGGIFYLHFNSSLREGPLFKLIENSKYQAIDEGFPYPTALTWLKDYFSGGKEPCPAPVNLDFGTPFQQRVWEELLKMPYGRIYTYGQLAQRIGCPSARAVGTAIGNNPLPIIVPCHRCVRKDGALGGYGFGMDMKIGLLELEGVPLIGRSGEARVSLHFLMGYEDLG